jgi:hypothetical protein
MTGSIFEAFKEKCKKSYHPPAQIPYGFTGFNNRIPPNWDLSTISNSA